MARKSRKEDSVFYCEDCLSLRILGGKNMPEYCDECSSANIGQCSFDKWEAMYEEMYGRKFQDRDLTEDQMIERKLKKISENKKNGKSSRDV